MLASLGCRMPAEAALQAPALALTRLPHCSPLTPNRCLMCYHRNHYQAFAPSQEAGCWLRFDDDKVAAVGPWPAVVAALVGGRMQPSVLFYEAPSPAGRAGPAGAVLS